MARFTLTINTENSAFHDDPPGEEVARILREAARRIERSGPEEGFSLRDINGNTVGMTEYDDDPFDGLDD